MAAEEDNLSFQSALDANFREGSPTTPATPLRSGSLDGHRHSVRQAKHETAKRYREERSKYQEEKAKMSDSNGYDLEEPPYKTGVLKIRNTLRTWTKFYCELRHGMLLLYKEDKHDVWMGTIMLSGGMVLERPSRKEGYVFKFSHPLRAAIHAPRGPKNEIWLNMLRIPSDHCMFRVSSSKECEDWIKAFKRAIYGPHPKFKTRMAEPSLSKNIIHGDTTDEGDDRSHDIDRQDPTPLDQPHVLSNLSQQLRKAGEAAAVAFEADLDATDTLVPAMRSLPIADYHPPQPPVAIEEHDWQPHNSAIEQSPGLEGQRLDMSEDAKAIVWAYLQNVSPNSSVQLPAALCQPRSFLDRMSDWLCHSDLLTDASKHATPQGRFMCVLRWYLSNFYLKAAGPLRPTRPLLGEVFRAAFEHPGHGTTASSRVFVAGEQVAPDRTCMHACNRLCGWFVTADMTQEHRFLGDSLVTLHKGSLTVTLERVGETYIMNMPALVTQGLCLGTTLTGYSGSATLDCQESGWRFKGTFDADGNIANHLAGQVTHQSELKAELMGEWDGLIHVTAPQQTPQTLLAANSVEFAMRRLPRLMLTNDEMWHYPPKGDHAYFDSTTVWSRCQQLDLPAMQALLNNLAQSEQARDASKHSPHFFNQVDAGYVYNGAVGRPWDFLRDVYDYQEEGYMKTFVVSDTQHVQSEGVHTSSLRRRRPPSLSQYAPGNSMSSGGVTPSTSVFPSAAPAPPLSSSSLSRTVQQQPASAAAATLEQAQAPVGTTTLTAGRELEQRVARLEGQLMMERVVIAAVTLVLVLLMQMMM
eukprot:TRINITY_DN10186_c0_g2_i1.p1 TRINITY_DN10186_c0_g2~~TRINITY_DN10186_c0_g2_i1.p1  ORF type:complete len:807 (+),score=217.60 TRINITY_DN10186_c0_g2_i1:48-2468(+)